MFEAVRGVHRRCKGAYAVVVMLTGRGIVAFRDPNGIRPLVYGVRESKHGYGIYGSVRKRRIRRA